MVRQAAIVRNLRSAFNPGSLRVLFYHRIGDPYAEQADLAPDLIGATPERFERQLRHISRAYHPVGAAEVQAALDGRHTLPPRAVLVTFDDAYRDFGDIAWPLLKQYHVPAVLFAPTAYPSQPEPLFWWDAVWQALARTDQASARLPNGTAAPLGSLAERMAAWAAWLAWLKTPAVGPARRPAAIAALAHELRVRPTSTHAILDWPALRSLAADGVTIGGHSRTHELLDQADAEALRSEIGGCRDDLVRELGHCPPLFAYPNGNVSSAACAAVSGAGFRLGFTTVAGLNTPHWTASPLLLRREGSRTSLLRFALKLLGPLGLLRARRRPLPNL